MMLKNTCSVMLRESVATSVDIMSCHDCHDGSMTSLRVIVLVIYLLPTAIIAKCRLYLTFVGDAYHGMLHCIIYCTIHRLMPAS